MKKKMILILALVMTASMSINVFAANTATVTTDGGKQEITVSGTYSPGQGTGGTKISVEIAWEEMSFTYTEGAAGEWDPSTHQYAETATGSWSADTKTITVTNHSNAAVNATLSFAASETAAGVVGTFTESSGTANDNILALASAAEGESLGNVSKAPTAEAEFGISGAAITANTTLGTITVSIATAQ